MGKQLGLLRRICLISLLLVNADWVTHLTLLDTNVTFSNFTLLTNAVRPIQHQLNRTEMLCSADTLHDLDNCQQACEEKLLIGTTSWIWLTHLNESEEIEDKLRLAYAYKVATLIVVTDRSQLSVSSDFRSLINVLSTGEEGLWSNVVALGGLVKTKLEEYEYCKL